MFVCLSFLNRVLGTLVGVHIRLNIIMFYTQKLTWKWASFSNEFEKVFASILDLFSIRFSHVVYMCENHKNYDSTMVLLDFSRSGASDFDDFGASVAHNFL